MWGRTSRLFARLCHLDPSRCLCRRRSTHIPPSDVVLGHCPESARPPRRFRARGLRVAGANCRWQRLQPIASQRAYEWKTHCHRRYRRRFEPIPLRRKPWCWASAWRLLRRRSRRGASTTRTRGLPPPIASLHASSTCTDTAQSGTMVGPSPKRQKCSGLPVPTPSHQRHRGSKGVARHRSKAECLIPCGFCSGSLHERIDHAPKHRFFCRQGSSERQPAKCASSSDPRDQAPQPAPTGRHAQRNVDKSHSGTLGRKDVVAGSQQLCTAPQRRPVDGSNDHRGARRNSVEAPRHYLRHRSRTLGFHQVCPHGAQVTACAKCIGRCTSEQYEGRFQGAQLFDRRKKRNHHRG